MIQMLSLVLLSLVAQSAGVDEGSSSARLESSWRPRFEVPQRLRADGKYVRVDEPGFACPSWVDLDADGESELVVGQLKEGRMRAYTNQGGLNFGPGSWLQAEGNDIQTPGVW